MKKILKMKCALPLYLLLLLPVATWAQEQSSFNPLDEYFQLVREEYNGENAYNTVAFVEQYWRIAGNEGFNKSISHVEKILKEAGYAEESSTMDETLSYRIESRPMKSLTWEPLDATLQIVGEPEPLLQYSSNRNMIAVNSWSSEGTIRAEVLFVEEPVKESLKNLDVKGKILFSEGNLRGMASELTKQGALGVMDYYVPEYLNPSVNVNSIQFRGIRQDKDQKAWAIVLSTAAKERLMEKISAGEKVEVEVNIQTKLYQAEELTLVAEVKGAKFPEQRFVFSAHVQEPGANDNASGVGAQAEMARTLAALLKEGKFAPDRTITFLFGDEIISTRRFISDDANRAKNIRWGMSLDMVGEDTDKTGGTFLIEKMPDPAAVWLRGDDKHTEWGGSAMDKSKIVHHYYNDLVAQIFVHQGQYANWEVNVNPFEGGSDHVPFLRANIPGVLLWHFTDQFYHTDGDRIDKVSAKTLQNVGVGALVTSMFLASSDYQDANFTLRLLVDSFNSRLQTEVELSKSALLQGSDLDKEMEILNSWINYYVAVCDSVSDMLQKDDTKPLISDAQQEIKDQGFKYTESIK